MSFEVRKGEIVGFAGLVGAGPQRNDCSGIFGLTPGSTGDVYLNGQKVLIRKAVEAMKLGIAMVPENRKLEGLYHVQSVKVQLHHRSAGEVHQQTDRQRQARRGRSPREFIDKMRTKTPSQEQRVANLSGGNQQKVMIGRWLATDPKILILDEPTRGVDARRQGKRSTRS